MRLHHHPASQHSRRVAMLVHELQLDVQVRIVDFNKGEHKAPEFLAHNPNGKVPVLEDGDFWLWESNAILAYLADKKPGNSLYPTEVRQRADVNRWLFWESAHFGPACLHLTWERVMKPMMMKQDPDPVLVAYGESSLERFGAVLDSQLKTREFITGSLSLADLSIASVLGYRQAAKMNLSPFPHLLKWMERMEARDSWKKTEPKF